MIITEIDTSSEDSETTNNVEVIELGEKENNMNYEMLKSINYYLEDEDINNECCNLLLEKMVKPIFSSDELEFEEFLLTQENNSKEFKVESFTKTFKTLVDIVTEPIVDECPSVSSSGSESSDESFSIIPMIKSISTKFIKQTSKFFSPEVIDLIDFSVTPSESGDLNEVDNDNIDANSGEELEGNNCYNDYQMENGFRDVEEMEYNESNQKRLYPTEGYDISKSNVHYCDQQIEDILSNIESDIFIYKPKDSRSENELRETSEAKDRDNQKDEVKMDKNNEHNNEDKQEGEYNKDNEEVEDDLEPEDLSEGGLDNHENGDESNRYEDEINKTNEEKEIKILDNKENKELGRTSEVNKNNDELNINSLAKWF